MNKNIKSLLMISVIIMIFVSSIFTIKVIKNRKDNKNSSEMNNDVDNLTEMLKDLEDIPTLSEKEVDELWEEQDKNEDLSKDELLSEIDSILKDTEENQLPNPTDFDDFGEI